MSEESLGTEIQFKNETKWDSQALLDIVIQVVKDRAYDIKHLLVTIRTSRRHGWQGDKNEYCYHGLAWNWWNRIEMFAPTPNKQDKHWAEGSDGRKYPVRTPHNFQVENFAQIFVHELDHINKLDHEDMIECRDINVDYLTVTEVPRRN